MIDRSQESRNRFRIQRQFRFGLGCIVTNLNNAAQRAGAHALLEISRPLLPTADLLLPYLLKIDEGRRYSNFGPLVSDFEEKLADRFEDGAGVLTGVNATQLLTLALQTLNPVEGAVCILPSWTFVATAHAVKAAGLTPYFVDVAEPDGELTPEIALAALGVSPQPVACVMPVMAFGAPMDLGAWADFRDQTGIPVIIDGAAGFDSVSTAPVPVVVSLHATKVLGIGEGGFIASTDPAYLAGVRQRSNFGFHGARAAEVAATNAKLSEYSAAIGLAGLANWSQTRLRWLLSATKLRSALSDLPSVRFQKGWGITWVSSTCVVRLGPSLRGHVEEVFASYGTPFRNWWGAGCHEESAFAQMPRTSLPNTKLWVQDSVGIPYYPDLTDEDVSIIASALKRVAAKAGGQVSAQ